MGPPLSGPLPRRALISLGAQEMMATIHSKPQGKFFVWAGLESGQSPKLEVPSHMLNAKGRGCVSRVGGGTFHSHSHLASGFPSPAAGSSEPGELPSWGQRITDSPAQAILGSGTRRASGQLSSSLGSEPVLGWAQPMDLP